MARLIKNSYAESSDLPDYMRNQAKLTIVPSVKEQRIWITGERPSRKVFPQLTHGISSELPSFFRHKGDLQTSYLQNPYLDPKPRSNSKKKTNIKEVFEQTHGVTSLSGDGGKEVNNKAKLLKNADKNYLINPPDVINEIDKEGLDDSTASLKQINNFDIKESYSPNSKTRIVVPFIPSRIYDPILDEVSSVKVPSMAIEAYNPYIAQYYKMASQKKGFNKKMGMFGYIHEKHKTIRELNQLEKSLSKEHLEDDKSLNKSYSQNINYTNTTTPMRSTRKDTENSIFRSKFGTIMDKRQRRNHLPLSLSPGRGQPRRLTPLKGTGQKHKILKISALTMLRKGEGEYSEDHSREFSPQYLTPASTTNNPKALTISHRSSKSITHSPKAFLNLYDLNKRLDLLKKATGNHSSMKTLQNIMDTRKKFEGVRLREVIDKNVHRNKHNEDLDTFERLVAEGNISGIAKPNPHRLNSRVKIDVAEILQKKPQFIPLDEEI